MSELRENKKITAKTFEWTFLMSVRNIQEQFPINSRHLSLWWDRLPQTEVYAQRSKKMKIHTYRSLSENVHENSPKKCPRKFTLYVHVKSVTLLMYSFIE